MAVTKVNGVVVEKPWFLSKKVILAAIAFGVALYSAWSGKNLDPAALEAHIATTATLLAPLVTLILGLAHVDANVRHAALSALDVAENVNKPDAPNQVQPAPGPFDDPAIKRL